MSNSLWNAARSPESVDKFIETRGLDEAYRQFHKAHRNLANMMIRKGVTSEQDEDGHLIYASWLYKKARKRCRVLYLERHGLDATLQMEKKLNRMYTKATPVLP